MVRLDSAAVVSFVLAAAAACGCGGGLSGAHASDGRDARVAAPVRIAVLPPVWVAGGSTLSVNAESAVMRGLGAQGGVAAQRTSADALGERSAAQCAEDLACVCEVGARERVAKAVVTRLAQLGDTVVVRIALVDVRGGTQEQVRQEVVRDATAARVSAAIERVGRELARPFAPSREPQRGAWYTSWPFWTGVAVLAAAGATATILVVTQDNGRQPDGTITPP